MNLSTLEHEAATRAIATVSDRFLQECLTRQLGLVHLVGRVESSFGYYIDFAVSEDAAKCDCEETLSLEAQARHPDGKNMLFFIFYVRGGVFCFMEASSTSDWPSEIEQVTFIDA